MAVELHFQSCMRRTGIDLSDSLRGVYVLIVNADATGRTLQAAVLRYCAAYVHAVSSLGDALTAMTHMVPDAIIVDAAMAEQDAFAFIRDVRALKPLEGGNVAAIGVGPASAERDVRASGFDSYLPKPFDPWELCAVIGRLVAR